MTAAVMTRVTPEADEVFQAIGTVLEVEAGSGELRVRSDDGLFHAERAVSCLVAPEPDDVVLFAGRRDGRLFVLAVLEREGEGALKVSGSRDLQLTAEGGKVTIAAKDGLDLLSGDELSLTSRSMSLRAGEGLMFFENLSYLGQRFTAELERAKTVVGALESVAERLVERVDRAYRFVNEMDQLRAGAIDHVARKLYRVHGDHVVATAKKLVKVDGEQIHMG